jgi:hypothetical protein
MVFQISEDKPLIIYVYLKTSSRSTAWFHLLLYVLPKFLLNGPIIIYQYYWMNSIVMNYIYKESKGRGVLWNTDLKNKIRYYLCSKKCCMILWKYISFKSDVTLKERRFVQYLLRANWVTVYKISTSDQVAKRPASYKI